MKLNMKINPAKLFGPSKKSRSISRSQTDPLSFNSQATSSSSSHDGSKNHDGNSTPNTVLPTGDLSEEFSADVYHELKQAFAMIDRDGDGKIEKEELATFLSRIGADSPSRVELKTMLNEVDRDGDGCISLEDFYSIGSAFSPPACDTELKNTFDFFDSDHDGRITAEELFNAFKTIGDARCTLDDCRAMIKNVGRSGDGFVCFDDFIRMMV